MFSYNLASTKQIILFLFDLMYSNFFTNLYHSTNIKKQAGHSGVVVVVGGGGGGGGISQSMCSFSDKSLIADGPVTNLLDYYGTGLAILFTNKEDLLLGKKKKNYLGNCSFKNQNTQEVTFFLFSTPVIFKMILDHQNMK